MSENTLHKVLTLKLNRNWMPIGQTPIQKLMVDMVTGVVCGIDINYEVSEDGKPDFDTIESMGVVGWDKWVDLPVRLPVWFHLVIRYHTFSH